MIFVENGQRLRDTGEVFDFLSLFNNYQLHIIVYIYVCVCNILLVCIVATFIRFSKLITNYKYSLFKEIKYSTCYSLYTINYMI